MLRRKLDGKCSPDGAVEGGGAGPSCPAGGAGGGFLSGGGGAVRWGWATRGSLLRLLNRTHPEPSGPVPSAAAGPRLPREGALPSPARPAACTRLPASPSAVPGLCRSGRKIYVSSSLSVLRMITVMLFPQAFCRLRGKLRLCDLCMNRIIAVCR